MTAQATDHLLRLGASLPVDNGRSVIRVPRSVMKDLALTSGQVVAVSNGGEPAVYARVLPGPAGRQDLSLDEELLQNCSLEEGQMVVVRPVATTVARAVTVDLADKGAGKILGIKRLIQQDLEHKPVVEGKAFVLTLAGGRIVRGTVVSVSAQDGMPALVSPATRLTIRTPSDPNVNEGVGYRDLGGLDREIAKVREIAEGPLRHTELFEQLGVVPPRGILFTGPPGTGKTLLAKAVALETGASFFHIAGPEIASKHFGESERQLREIFQKATAKAPSIVFIDEIDAIAPKRDSLSGEKQVERRMVAQLLTLLDGLEGRGQVLVMAATNMPDSLDGALRRPGRFDREVAFQPPSVDGRYDILMIHSRNMPLADNVDLNAIASSAHGFVGADLAALCREAGMNAFRRLTEHEGLGSETPPVSVIQDDFLKAMSEIRPTALRELFTERPDVTFTDVGGQETVKQLLEESVILPLRYRELVEQCGVEPAGGILLAGPPGTGKTLLAKALAGEAGVNFISVQGSEIVSQFFGEAERTVRELFSKARMTTPCIIFIDEIDAMAPRRGSDAGAMDRVVGQFLTELDGMKSRNGVILLAATNRVSAIDPALLRPGRIDRILEVGLPDKAAREHILSVHLRDRKLSEDVSIPEIASDTEGFSGADLAAVTRNAALSSLRRSLLSTTGEALPIAQSELEAAVIEIAETKKRALKENVR